MKQYKNRMIWLLRFAKQHKNQTMLTCRELFDIQDEAAGFNKVVLDKITKGTLKKHKGWTLKRWKEVLLSSTRFFWLPNEEEAQINKEIKTDTKKALGYLPPQVLYSYNMFSGYLSRLAKENKILRTKNTKGLWVYYI